MNRTGHAITGLMTCLLFSVISVALRRWWMVPRYLVVFVIFVMLADQDHAWHVPHRNWFFHSLILPVGFTILFWGVPGTSFSIVIQSVHLLSDIYQSPGKKPVGAYNVAFWSGKRLSSRGTKAWLWIQGTGGFLAGLFLDLITGSASTW